MINSQKNKIMHGLLTVQSKNTSFNKTLSRVQKDLSNNNAIFSRIIHKEKIDTILEIISKYIATPEAIFCGSSISFAVTLLLLIISKLYSYNLSGLETVLSFLLGWIIGLIYSLIKNLFQKPIIE